MTYRSRATQLLVVFGISVLSVALGACAGKGSADKKEPAAASTATSGQPDVAIAPPKAGPSPQVAASVVSSTPPAGQGVLTDIAEQRVTAVVNISTVKEVKQRGSFTPFGMDPFFNRHFGQRRGRHPMMRRAKSLGSGVIVSREGIVLTNNHVVDHATEIKVATSDGKEFKAELVGRDPKSDVAVIKLKGTPAELAELKPIPFGDSSKLRLAETVLAIGNPFGLGHTVTSGIVSAKGRANMGIVDYEDFIQTDAAINPGNSGGALINMRGELVGINTAILSKSGGYQGIGFAIPSNMVKNIMESLLNNGTVVRGWLGVVIQDLNEDIAKMMKLSVNQGVIIADVQTGSPAHKAGFKRGDVIVRMNHWAMHSSGVLRSKVATLGEGKEVTFDVLRGGTKISLKVVLGRQPGSSAVLGGNAKPGSLSGLSLSPLTGSLRMKYQLLPQIPAGLVVTNVMPGSNADKAGLRVGDVVLEVNRMSVTNLDQFLKAHSAAKGRLLLLIARGNRTFYQVLQK